MVNHEMDRAIDKRLRQLHITEEMKKRILTQTQGKKRVRTRTVILAACLCILFAVPALAVTVPEFRNLLRNVRNDLVQMLKPVELVSESNGIRMEVLAAANDDNSVIAFISMKDMAGGEMNGDVDLYDYIISGFNMFTFYTIAQDDPQTALLCIVANGGSSMNGKKATLSVTSFLSGRKVFDTFDTKVDLSKVSEGQSVLMQDMNGNAFGGGGKDIEAYMRGEDVKVLAIGQMDIKLPMVDFVVISNIGIIEGRLHVQTKWPYKMENNEHIDDHGWFYLENEKGEQVKPSGVSFRQDGIAYDEYIFDVADPSGYRLYAESMTTNERFVKGNWQVTFPITAAKTPRNINADIELGSVRITSVSLSPLGIAVSGTGKEWPEDERLSVRFKDGSVIEYASAMDQSDDGKLLRKYYPDGALLEPDEIEAIIIHGVELTP